MYSVRHKSPKNWDESSPPEAARSVRRGSKVRGWGRSRGGAGRRVRSVVCARLGTRLGRASFTGGVRGLVLGEAEEGNADSDDHRVEIFYPRVLRVVEHLTHNHDRDHLGALEQHLAGRRRRRRRPGWGEGWGLLWVRAQATLKTCTGPRAGRAGRTWSGKLTYFSAAYWPHDDRVFDRAHGV